MYSFWYVSLVVMSQIINKVNRLLSYWIFNCLSTFIKDSTKCSKVRFDCLNFLMKLANKLWARKHMLSFLEYTINSNLFYENCILRLWWGKQFCKDDKIRIHLSCLLYHMSCYKYLSTVKVIHSESIEVVCHLSDVFEHVLPCCWGILRLFSVTNSE